MFIKKMRTFYAEIMNSVRCVLVAFVVNILKIFFVWLILSSFFAFSNQRTFFVFININLID